MISSVGTKVAGVGTSDSENRFKMRARTLIVPVLCLDFAVTLGPYVP
jgi:hypothetical protein